MDKNRKTPESLRLKYVRIFAFLSIPFGLMFVLTFWILVQMGHDTAMLERYLAMFLWSVGGMFILQIVIFWKKIVSELSQIEIIRKLLGEQEKGAQLLVRRDLELTQANERLRKLDGDKSNFITVVAHQLRTPLSGIKWTISLLLKGDLGSLTKEQENFLSKASESNDRMITLVNDMLGADRIDSGKLRYDFEPVQLLDVVDKAIAELSVPVAARGLTVTVINRPSSLPPVLADKVKIRSVFSNLLDNAIKYSKAGGKVEVTLRGSGEEVEVCIKDNGIGIPKEEQRNIFERFFRAKNAVKAETDGSGLGLYIAKSIVEKHHGRMRFESEEGKGVIFCFSIPVAKGALPMDKVSPLTVQ